MVKDMKKTYKYVKLTNTHIPQANGNQGFLIKEVRRGGSLYSQVLWFEPKNKVYNKNWFSRFSVREK